MPALVPILATMNEIEKSPIFSKKKNSYQRPWVLVQLIVWYENTLAIIILGVGLKGLVFVKGLQLEINYIPLLSAGFISNMHIAVRKAS